MPLSTATLSSKTSLRGSPMVEAGGSFNTRRSKSGSFLCTFGMVDTPGTPLSVDHASRYRVSRRRTSWISRSSRPALIALPALPSSFARQVNGWSFKRITCGPGRFWAAETGDLFIGLVPHFVRNLDPLCVLAVLHQTITVTTTRCSFGKCHAIL
jgi:hypothetical protein